MDDRQRLIFILEAVRYCKRVKEMGMPAQCYTKALLEPVHFLWQRRKGSKESAAQFRSEASLGLRFGRGRLRFHGLTPFRDTQSKLLGLRDPTPDRIEHILKKSCEVVLLTRKEHEHLRRLKRKMPERWKELTPRERFKIARIKIVRNPSWALGPTLP